MPDLDIGWADDGLAELAARHGLSFTLLVAPTTPPDRVAGLVGRCSGFVYMIARLGITGEREMPPDVSGRVAGLRRATALPIAVGFGISRPEHVAAATASADAAIVGSAIVRRMGQGPDPAGAAADLVRQLAGGLARRAVATRPPPGRPRPAR